MTNNNKTKLLSILNRKPITDEFKTNNCDEPRHTIIIYQNLKESFIDICFGCKRIHTSKDLTFSESDLDEEKWNELELYFKQNSIIKLFSEN